MWAAYKRGAFKDIEQKHIPAGLNATDFQKFFLAYIGHILRGGEAFVPLVEHRGRQVPGGLAVAFCNPPYMEPHIYWFPEATPRARLEVTLRFFIDMKVRHKLIIWAPQPHWTFFDHLCKYGVLRAVGKYRNFMPDGGDVILFQGVT